MANQTAANRTAANRTAANQTATNRATANRSAADQTRSRTTETERHRAGERSTTASDGGSDDNRVRLRATVTTAPERRTLPSDDEVVSFGVSVPREAGGTDAIPIQVGPAPASGRRPAPGQVGRRLLATAARLRTGDRVVIEGRLRRRWWDAGGVRRSRIEVAATTVDVVPETPP